MLKLVCKVLRRFDILRYFNLSMYLDGLVVPVVGGIGIEHCDADREDWATLLFKMLLNRRPGAFVDVGMNIGQTMLRVLPFYPERPYYGFEPNISCYNYVCALVLANGWTHVRLAPVGLSDRAQLGLLFAASATDPCATTVEGFRGSEENRHSQLVALFRGDDLLPGGIDVAVIKVDVEGGELEVLAGLHNTIVRTRPFIVCEILPSYDEETEIGSLRRKRTNALLSLLSSFQYKLARMSVEGYLVRIDGIETHGDLHRCEYLFYPAEMDKDTFPEDSIPAESVHLQL